MIALIAKVIRSPARLEVSAALLPILHLAEAEHVTRYLGRAIRLKEWLMCPCIAVCHNKIGTLLNFGGAKFGFLFPDLG
jgi:hypothetical protein